MKDIFGKDIKIGDEVAFNPPYLKGLIRGKVIGTKGQHTLIIESISRWVNEPVAYFTMTDTKTVRK